MHRLLIGFFLVVIAALNGFHSAYAMAEENAHRPLWELGLGAGGVWAADYPGSDHSRVWVLPFPWGVYRGEIFRSDREGGTRARVLRGASYELNFSAGGGLPSSSEDNEARRGMPDLEWLAEIGPRFVLDLSPPGESGRLRLGIPARSAFSTDGRRVRDRGWVFAPELIWTRSALWNTRFEGFAILNTYFADRRHHDYFYSVNPRQATSTRPAYRSRAGYLMTELSLGMMLPPMVRDLRVFVFGSVQSLHGAANEESPLLRTRWNNGVNVALLWSFASSSSYVRAEE